MSIAQIVTRGYGSFGSIMAVVLRGYSLPPPVSGSASGTLDNFTLSATARLRLRDKFPSGMRRTRLPFPWWRRVNRIPR